MTADKSMVAIDLFKPNLPGAIDKGEFVQQALKNRLIEHIEAAAPKNDKENKKTGDSLAKINGIISEAGRQVFFIDGTRGAGKTTFMNEIVSHFKDTSHIHALRCIDPTKLPQIEPILVTVIAQLNSDVSKKLRTTCGWNSEQNLEKENWQDCLKSISRAIQLLGNKEYSANFFDEALELNALLSNASDGLGLEEQFSKLLEQACKILNCNAILVAFDDIDTQFNTGWQVLEAIRKYFNSPRLIVLMTGDLRLYSQLIRGKQYGNYDDVMLKEEATEKEKISRSIMVNHLEQQYLIKLLPVHRRINLQSLYQLADEKNNDWPIYVVVDRSEKGVPLRDAINKMLEEGLHLRQSDDLNLYAEEILKQPIRLVIQLLQRYYQQKEANPGKTSADILSEAIRSTMLGSIYKAGLTYDSTDAHVGVIAKDIFNYTLMDGDSNTGFYLRPQSESEILRSSAIYLASMVSKVAENSLWKTLHLMLAGCGSVTLYEKLLQENPQKLSNEQIEQACRTYFGLGRSESLMHWANRSNAALCPVNQDTTLGVHPGLLRLNRSKPKSTSTSTSTSKQNSQIPIPDTAVYDSSKEASFLARLAVDIASSDLAGRNMHSFISIPNLLGGIADLMEGFEPTGKDDSLKALLAKLAFRTTCSAPPWASLDKSAAGDIDDESADVDEHDLEVPTGSESIISTIRTWLLFVKEPIAGVNASSILIGKIWTRLYFNLTNIAEAHGNNLGSRDGLKGTKSTDTNAAKIMRFNVIALLHAVLFEEDAYHKTGSMPIFTEIGERKNPVTSVELFVDKLDKLKRSCGEAQEIKRRLPIFYLLITCPLLHPFLFAEGSILASAKSKEDKFDGLIQGIISEVYDDYSPKNHALVHLCKASITAARYKSKSETVSS